MTTQFITVELHLNDTDDDLRQAIEAQLKTQGEPLRWAITAVANGIVQVEAVVIQGAEAAFVTEGVA